MMDIAIAWMCNNPLQAVAVLAGAAISIGLLLIPGLHELQRHGHPRL